MRQSAGLSIRALGKKCAPPVAPSYISAAEKWGGMYDGHLARVAAALHYEGDPRKLLDEIPDEQLRGIEAR